MGRRPLSGWRYRVAGETRRWYEPTMEVADLFSRGGAVMYVIAVASVAGLAVFLERMWSLQRAKVCPRDLIDRVLELVAKGDTRDAAVVASEARSSIGAIFAAILKKAGQPLPFVKEAAEEVGRQEAARLERFVGALGTVASITPLLGLLGTVTGMIGVFQRVAETGVGNPLDMAAGIWEALLTTAFGLGVGIPALLAHRFTLSRVDTLVLELEEEALRMAELAAGGWNDATPGED
jgi:biopolymer transport protein ExbB